MKRETQRQQLIRWAKGLGAKVSSGRGWVSISWLSWQQDFDSWAEAYAAAVRWQRAHEEGQPWPWAEYQAWESRRRTHPGEMPPPRRRNPGELDQSAADLSMVTDPDTYAICRKLFDGSVVVLALVATPRYAQALLDSINTAAGRREPAYITQLSNLAPGGLIVKG